MHIPRRPRKTEDVYRTVPLHDIPWITDNPPEVLVRLVKSGIIQPCRCIELGCGIGNHALFLSQRGFSVTGIDNSPTAIHMARENARKKDVRCDFAVMDVLDAGNYFRAAFHFAFDWEVLHHVFPNKRRIYIENVFNLLNTGGKYLSVCFSDKDPQFGGKGKYRYTPLGTLLYFSSEQELRRLFSRYFRIVDLRTIEIQGKKGSHLAIYALLEKE